LESAYESCCCRELALRGLRFDCQRPLAIDYKGALVRCAYRLDLVIEDTVVIELKTVEALLPIHVAQVVTYLRLTGLPVGLLVNFNVRLLKDGIRRLWLAPPPD
jgi:GxxExxY protein